MRHLAFYVNVFPGKRPWTSFERDAVVRQLGKYLAIQRLPGK